jgi:hypothetical protein
MGLSGRGKWYSFWCTCAAAVSIIARTDLTKWVCRLSIDLDIPVVYVCGVQSDSAHLANEHSCCALARCVVWR